MPDEPTNSLINFKDLTGLSQPLTKLIKTFSAGCGRMSDGISRLANAYILARKDTDNEVYRIKEVNRAETQALTERAQAIADLTIAAPHVKQMDIAIGTVQAKLAGPSEEAALLLGRSNNRLAYQNAIHQLNIDAVVANAAATLVEEEQVSDEPVEQDWINRFFKLAEDVSTEEMQALWGRILAEEVKRPGSFSPRTLQLLSTITRAEALDFQKLCMYNWSESDGQICNTLVSAVEQTPAGLGFNKLQHLDDVGLIKYSPLGTLLTYSDDDISKLVLTYDKSTIEIIALGSKETKVDTGPILLTKAGVEIARICGTAYDSSIFEDTLRFWISRGYCVSSRFPKEY